MTRLAAGAPEGFAAWAGARRAGGDAPTIDLTKALAPATPELVAVLQDAAVAAGGLVGHHGYYPLGLPALRAAIAARYELRGVPTAPEQILVTAGAQQAVDLVFRTWVRPHEPVIVESPTYAGALDSLRLARARTLSLDVASSGWDLDALAALIAQTGARMAYLTPDFQNPTGRQMNADERARLARLCHRHGVMLVVDEAVAEIVLDPRAAVAPVAAHDPGHSVVSIGSLSKTVWAGLRVGWVRASPTRLAELAATRSTADLGGAPVEQLAAAQLLPGLDAILDARRDVLVRRRDALVAATRQLGWRVGVPQGGLSTWVELPDGSSTLLADVAQRHGVLLIPGPRLSPDGVLDRFLRLPYGGGFPVEVLEAAVARLGRAWEELAFATGRDGVLQVV